MEMKIVFPGNKKVDAIYNGVRISTDQPAFGGGDGTAPAPFDLFLASLGTCAGIYVLGFCQQRGLPTEGIELTQRMEFDPTRRMISKVNLEISVPPTFPEKYHDALIKSASLCAVKKHIEEPPAFNIFTSVKEDAVA
ncbi:MAG: OsmC family protein [Bacteroidota bacterium]|jgi:ribosomal protein S12 methylthiotransferase accessory factor|nr:OsmC family protein [Bacteroidota bacterium]